MPEYLYDYHNIKGVPSYQPNARELQKYFTISMCAPVLQHLHRVYPFYNGTCIVWCYEYAHIPQYLYSMLLQYAHMP